MVRYNSAITRCQYEFMQACSVSDIGLWLNYNFRL